MIFTKTLHSELAFRGNLSTLTWMSKTVAYHIYLVIFALGIFFQSISGYASGTGETGYFITKIEKVYKKAEEEKKSTIAIDATKETNEKEYGNTGKMLLSEIISEKKEEIKKESEASTRSELDRSIEDFYSKLVLETYKAQLKRNIKDLDITLKKVYPAESDRLEAYRKIRETYENVQDNVQGNNVQDGVIILNRKQIKIYEESLSYLIGLLNIRINTLQK